jgi:hypothetical protein
LHISLRKSVEQGTCGAHARVSERRGGLLPGAAHRVDDNLGCACDLVVAHARRTVGECWNADVHMHWERALVAPTPTKPG